MTATTYTHIPGVKPGASFGDELSNFFWSMIEAKEKAVHVRFEDEIHGARSTEEYPYEDDLEDDASKFLQS